MSKFEEAFNKAGIGDAARLRVLADKLLAKADKNVFVAEESFLEAVNKDCGLLKALVGSQLQQIARKYLELCVADMSGKKSGSHSVVDARSSNAPAADIASPSAFDTHPVNARDAQTGTGKGHPALDTHRKIAHKPQRPRTAAEKRGALYGARRALDQMFVEMKMDSDVKYYELEAIAKQGVEQAAWKFRGSHIDAKRAFFARRAKEKCGQVLDDKQLLTDVLKEKTLVDLSRQAHQEAADFLKQASSLLAFSVFDADHRAPEQISP